MTKFVGIVCAKGGVGRTVVSINLAHSLQNLGYNTLVLDCDFTSPNIPIYLGMLTNEKTIHSVIRGNAKVNEVISLHDSGIRVIPGSIAYTDIKISNLDLLEKVLCEIEGYDIVLVDTPAGFNSNVGEIMNVMDDIICITTPELSALTDCLRTIKLADEQGKNIIGVIVNKFRDDALDM